jgi:Ribonuclease G/E
MAQLNENGQWIILMAFIVCIVLLILALIVNESVIVGQTTAEGVLEFSKSDVQDLKNEVTRIYETNCNGDGCNVVGPDNLINQTRDVELLSERRKNTLVNLTISTSETVIYFNNGVNQYDETHYL